MPITERVDNTGTPESAHDYATQLLGSLYGQEYNTAQLTDQFFDLCQSHAAERPEDLRRLDAQTDPLWYKGPENVGYIMYADLFAPDAGEGNYLQGVINRLDYLEELGVTLVHILPALKSSGDAGFAVDAYDEIDQRLGTMEHFRFTECHDEVSFQLPAKGLSRELYKFFKANGGVDFRIRSDQDYSEGISGTTYSLLGGDINAIKLLWYLKAALGGTPLFYMSEELGTENDLSFRDDPVKRDDSRFVKRVPITDKMRARRLEAGTKEATLFGIAQDVIAWRKAHPALATQPELVETKNSSILGLRAADDNEKLTMLANLSDEKQVANLDDGTTIPLGPKELWWQQVA